MKKRDWSLTWIDVRREWEELKSWLCFWLMKESDGKKLSLLCKLKSSNLWAMSSYHVLASLTLEHSRVFTERSSQISGPRDAFKKASQPVMNFLLSRSWETLSL